VYTLLSRGPTGLAGTGEDDERISTMATRATLIENDHPDRDYDVVDEYGQTWVVMASEGGRHYAVERDGGERWETGVFTLDSGSEGAGEITPAREDATFDSDEGRDAYYVARVDQAGSLRWESTWCVCGRESDRDPYEPLAQGLHGRDAAEWWLREHHEDAGVRSMTDLYIDRSDNDGHADTCYSRRSDGSIVEHQGSGVVEFAAAEAE
jgi:hypothetical protein